MMASVIICSRKSCRQRIENEAVPIIGSIHAQVHEPTVATDGAAPEEKLSPRLRNGHPQPEWLSADAEKWLEANNGNVGNGHG